MQIKYKISVIIPVYNAEQWLGRLCSSLEKQTVFNDLEIIFINDGSYDKSLLILNEFSNKYDNINIIDKDNTGVSDSRNRGIDKAKSKYIAFLDADDYIDEDFFESYYEYMEKDYDLITRGYIAEYSDGKRIEKVNEYKIIDSKENIMKSFLLGEIDPNCWNKLYKSEIIKRIKFDLNLKYGEDRDLLFRYIRNIKYLCIINKGGYHYLINIQSAMRNQNKRTDFSSITKVEERKKIIQSDFPNLIDYAYSNEIDAKCRIISNMLEFNLVDKNIELYNSLKRDVSKYSIIKKYKYSSKKHFFAFVLIKISPKLYTLIKNRMKFQYK